MKINSKVLTGIYTMALSLAFSVPVLATDAVEEKEADEAQKVLDAEQTRVTKLTQANDDVVLEEVITTGTRSSRPRTAADSTVPKNRP